MPTEQVWAPGFLLPLTFDTKSDLLGSGTVGEVFKVTFKKHQVSTQTAATAKGLSHFALKKLFNRAGRDDFENESNILKALSMTPHAHITPCLATWTNENASYMLFPLANGDLYHHLRNTVPSFLNQKVVIWQLEQMWGLCDALRYLHDYELDNTNLFNKPSRPMRRIGFHHDLKPANILLYGVSTEDFVWKITDFGSGTVKVISTSSEDIIYNRKPSTGDPVYSAPEWVVEGKVSQPKDIWSLGAIFLEILVWNMDQNTGAVERFELARMEIFENTDEPAPIFWYQDHDGLPYLNPAAVAKIDELKASCKKTGYLASVLSLVRQMLAISPKPRPTAAQLCKRFREILNDVQSFRGILEISPMT